MRWLLPQPVTSALIFGLWLALANSLAPGTLIMGGLLALLLPLATRRFWPDSPHVRRPLAALRLVVRVLGDILRANLTVARQVLGPVGKLRPAFFEVPVAIGDPFVATLLGGIISLTPGTVTIEIVTEGGAVKRLLVHGLDVPDEAAAVAEIRTRYEQPLKEIFGC